MDICNIWHRIVSNKDSYDYTMPATKTLFDPALKTQYKSNSEKPCEVNYNRVWLKVWQFFRSSVSTDFLNVKFLKKYAKHDNNISAVSVSLLFKACWSQQYAFLWLLLQRFTLNFVIYGVEFPLFNMLYCNDVVCDALHFYA